MRRPLLPALIQVLSTLLPLATAPALLAQPQPAASGDEEKPALETLSDEEQAKKLLDKDDPAAKEGVVIGARGIDPGWKDARRAERSPNIYGQTGLKRVTSAKADKSGYFDIGVHTSYFIFNDFIDPASTDGDTFTATNFTFGVSILDIVELGLATRAATNANTSPNIDKPLQFTTGEILPSLKVAYDLAPIAVGFDTRVSLPPAQNDVGFDLGNFSIAGTALLTLDLWSAYDIPFKTHLNAGYVYQNGRFSGDNQRYFATGLQGHLQALTDNQWFYDHLTYGLGVEAPLPYVTPYVEFFGQTAIGVPAGRGAGGANYNFLTDSSMILSPGVRLSAGRGLHFDLGVDLGLTGNGGFLNPRLDKLVDGQPINPFWAAQVGISYTFSPFVAETQVEVREKALGTASGCVVSTKNGKPVQDAIVEFTGTDGPRIAVDDNGCFTSPRLDPGDLVIRFKHPEYKPTEVTVQVVANSDAKANVKLVPQPRYGRFKGNITNDKDEPVDGVVELTDEDGELVTVNTEGGAFNVQLGPGKYQTVVKAEGYYQVGAPITVEPNGKTIRNFELKRLPKKRISLLTKDKIEITSKIPFEHNKARLLRAAEFILDDVVDLMLTNPQIKLIRIEGHTDNTGKEAYNIGLSEARANAVMEYLINKGIPQERLEAKGYGYSRPIASNDTEDGRARNRRVEFVIVDQGDDAGAAPAEGDSGAAKEDGEGGAG